MEPKWFEYDRHQQRIAVHTRGRILIIKLEDCDISYFSGGPGGQNVNKHMNGVRLIYDIPENCLNVFQKTRQLMTRSMSQRNREENLATAFDQMAEKVKDYFYVAPPRSKTKVPRGSKEKRLEGKMMRGKVKENRRHVGE